MASGGGDGGDGGALPECITATDCPGTDGECSWRTCSAGTCGVAYAAAGTPLAEQTTGDCYTVACDGAGQIQLVYTPGDIELGDPNCMAANYCTESGPVAEPMPDGTKCNTTCGCPQLNGGVCGASDAPCTQGLCSGGTCVDAIPVSCMVNSFTTYTRCDLTAGQHTIYWGTNDPDCQTPGVCSCSTSQYDVDYCPPGTICYVNDANGWLGPQDGTGTCL